MASCAWGDHHASHPPSFQDLESEDWMRAWDGLSKCKFLLIMSNYQVVVIPRVYIALSCIV